MGIHDLNKVLANEAANSRTVLPLSLLAGRKVAIDGSNYIFMTWMTANKQVVNSTNVAVSDIDRDRILQAWLTTLWSFLRRFLSKSITPIFVFDGVHPTEKSETQEKRREERNKTHAQVLDLQETISKMDALEIDPTLIEKLRTLLRRDTFIAGDELEIFQTILQSIGIPVLQAPGEAEKFCTMLVLEGKASAVFSTDTDTLVYGCPLLITGFTTSKLDMMEVTILDRALKGLNFTFIQFQELCYLLGCDYNKRIRGIGPVKAVQHLRKYGSIDKFPDKLDRTCLKLETVRKLFAREPTNLTEDQVTLQRSALGSARPILEAFQVSSWMELLVEYYSKWNSIATSEPLILSDSESPTVMSTKPSVINKKVLKEFTKISRQSTDDDE